MSSGRDVFCDMMSDRSRALFEKQIQTHAEKNVLISNWASLKQSSAGFSAYTKFRALFFFMKQCICRLADHHMRIIRFVLQTGKRRYKHLPSDSYDEFPEFYNLRKQSPLRHQIIFALASLRLSIVELFGGCSGGIVRWRDDYNTCCGLRFQNETTREEYIDAPFDRCVRTDIHIELYADFGMADLYRCCPCCLQSGNISSDESADLFGVKPGSKRHFEYLLRPIIHPCLKLVFGEEFCLKHFNATKSFQEMFQRILSRLQSLEGRIHNTDDFGDVSDLKDDDSLMGIDEDESEDEWMTDDDADDDNDCESDTDFDDFDHDDDDDDDDDDDYDDDDDDDDDDDNHYDDEDDGDDFHFGVDSGHDDSYAHSNSRYQRHLQPRQQLAQLLQHYHGEADADLSESTFMQDFLTLYLRMTMQ
jgi:hypothetical protein